MNNISLKNRSRCYVKSPTWQGVFSTNTRPHQLHWGGWEMGTATSWTECSRVTHLIQKVSRSFSKVLSFHAAVHAVGRSTCTYSGFPRRHLNSINVNFKAFSNMSCLRENSCNFWSSLDSLSCPRNCPSHMYLPLYGLFHRCLLHVLQARATCRSALSFALYGT